MFRRCSLSGHDPQGVGPIRRGSAESMRTVTGYLDELRATGRAPSTVRLRGYQLREFARWMGVEGSAVHAARAEVARYLARPMCAETRASKRAALSGFFEWAIETGRRSTRSPFVGVAAVRRPLGVPRPCPDLVVTEGLAFADAATSHAIILARFAGLRAAEVAAVSGRDITVDGRLQVLGKGSRARLIPLHPQVQTVLAGVDGWVFPSVYGGHWRAGTITKRVSRALPGGWTAHSLRHAFATEVYRESGHDLRLVQQLLGHSSPGTTARYVLVDDDLARSVVSSLSLAV